MSGDLAIARYVARSAAVTGLLGGSDPVEMSIVDQWLDLSLGRDLADLASTLDAHLAPRCVLYPVDSHAGWRRRGIGREGGCLAVFR